MSDQKQPQEAAAPEQPGEKYHLKPTETQLLVIVSQAQQQVFATLLSFIANERLGYRVTERTQFKLDAQLANIEISELPAAEVPVNPAAPADAPSAPAAPEQPEAPSAGAVAAR